MLVARNKRRHRFCVAVIASLALQCSVVCIAQIPPDDGGSAASGGELIEPVYLKTPESEVIPRPPGTFEAADEATLIGDASKSRWELEDEPSFDEQVGGSIIQTSLAPASTSRQPADATKTSAAESRSAAPVLGPISLPSQSPIYSYDPGNADVVAGTAGDDWTHQFLPDGLMFQSFLAGEKEPRFAAVWLHDPDLGTVWETALGGRVGIYRFGTQGSVHPQGWQFDVEGGVLTRLNWDEKQDVDAADFIVGFLMTRRVGRTSIEFGYTHLSSHVGDEYLIRNPGFRRINYVRDSLAFGLAYDVCRDVRVYGEVAVAPSPSEAEPLEFQTGAEYSPACCHIAPFAAINLHYRQEFDFQASVNVVAGWQLRGESSNRLLRVGVQHYNGKALQYSFFDQNEQLTGAGLWLDY